jgi:hypothetical protein
LESDSSVPDLKKNLKWLSIGRVHQVRVMS